VEAKKLPLIQGQAFLQILFLWKNIKERGKEKFTYVWNQQPTFTLYRNPRNKKLTKATDL
jgi:hypothetical protein